MKAPQSGAARSLATRQRLHAPRHPNPKAHVRAGCALVCARKRALGTGTNRPHRVKICDPTVSAKRSLSDRGCAQPLGLRWKAMGVHSFATQRMAFPLSPRAQGVLGAAGRVRRQSQRGGWYGGKPPRIREWGCAQRRRRCASTRRLYRRSSEKNIGNQRS